MRKKKRFIIIPGLCAVLLLIFAVMPARAYGGVMVAQGTMLHAQQMLERYSASGDPLLHVL